MSRPDEPPVLWRPSEEAIESAAITRYARWLIAERGVALGDPTDYQALWQWSVDELEDFWASIWEYFEVRASVPYERVLGERSMPGAEWFAGARLNYAEHVIRGKNDADVAIRHASELRELDDLELGEAGARDGRADRAPGCAGPRRRAGRPGRRLPAEHPRDRSRPSSPAPRSGRSWSSAARRSSAPARWSTASPRSSPRCCSRSTATATAVSDFDRGDVVVDAIAAEIPGLASIVLLSGLGYRADPGRLARGMHWRRFAGSRLPVTSSSFEPPRLSSIPSGSSTPRARPGSPSRSSTAQGGILLEHLKKMHLHLDAQDGRSRLLVHDDRLDDVELPRRGAAHRGRDRAATTATPAIPDLGVLWDLAERGRYHHLRDQRQLTSRAA